MAIIHGNNILLMIDGEAVAKAKSCELSVKCDTIETVGTAKAKGFVRGRYSWTMSASGLVGDLQLMSQIGSDVEVSMETRDESESLTGAGIITTLKLTATRGNLAQYSVQVTGTGVLTSAGNTR